MEIGSQKGYSSEKPLYTEEAIQKLKQFIEVAYELDGLESKWDLVVEREKTLRIIRNEVLSDNNLKKIYNALDEYTNSVIKWKSKYFIVKEDYLQKEAALLTIFPYDSVNNIKENVKINRKAMEKKTQKKFPIQFTSPPNIPITKIRDHAINKEIIEEREWNNFWKEEQVKVEKVLERNKIASLKQLEKDKENEKEILLENELLLKQQEEDRQKYLMQKTLESRCPSCGKIPDFLGRCGCS
ncbi:hypothetical protein [Bacillus cereus]|nr:hypothetical protein [Bacillus cereus]EDX60202.1 hypothetical protein BC03BB108_A0021 [Bacillus cereus 03BB108]QKH04541.1 hypothetical protein FOC96_30750 [Bacillus cereus]